MDNLVHRLGHFFLDIGSRIFQPDLGFNKFSILIGSF